MADLVAEGARVHSVVCDPPYHLHSIVKRFGAASSAAAKDTDGLFKRASAGFMGRTWDGGDIAWNTEMWRQCYDLMLPGAYIVAFASSRTFGRMSVAIEDAGFITHPMIGWIFGSGFPKATRLKLKGMEGYRYGGQALKPALEPIYVGQKPMEGTGAENWLKHGCGALNIDGCRVDADEVTGWGGKAAGGGTWDDSNSGICKDGEARPVIGRWPANLVHDGSDDVLAAFPQSDGHAGLVDGQSSDRNVYSNGVGPRPRMEPRNDPGSAARFFYAAKADTDDRCDSKHPTIKPVSLIRWLARLVTPPGGTILDPFAGSGTLGVAALREGFDAILIEREAEYVRDIRRRLDRIKGLDTPLFPSPMMSPSLL
jgi:site-specific DNA-methyltransferase (adenine-specific)